MPQLILPIIAGVLLALAQYNKEAPSWFILWLIYAAALLEIIEDIL